MPVNPIPKGYHTVTPLVSVRDAARMIDFMKAAFGATEVYRFTDNHGNVMHAEMKIGDSTIMLGEATEDSPTAAILYLYVEDADAVYRTALKAGGESLEGPEDRFWGDRTASVRDFSGNRWCIATHVEDVASDEIMERARRAMAA